MGFARNVTNLVPHAVPLKPEKPDLPPVAFAEPAAMLEERLAQLSHELGNPLSSGPSQPVLPEARQVRGER